MKRERTGRIGAFGSKGIWERIERKIFLDIWIHDGNICHGQWCSQSAHFVFYVWRFDCAPCIPYCSYRSVAHSFISGRSSFWQWWLQIFKIATKLCFGSHCIWHCIRHYLWPWEVDEKCDYKLVWFFAVHVIVSMYLSLYQRICHFMYHRISRLTLKSWWKVWWEISLSFHAFNFKVCRLSSAEQHQLISTLAKLWNINCIVNNAQIGVMISQSNIIIVITSIKTSIVNEIIHFKLICMLNTIFQY